MQFKHIIIDPEAPYNPHIKIAGDINNDGFADIVIASSNNGPLVWYEYPNWTKHVIHPSGTWSTDAKLVDMDGDGDLDILISDWYTHKRIEWFENPLPSGNPATDLWKHHVIGSPRAHDIQTADIDGDGVIEIVTRGQGNEGSIISIWKQINSSWEKTAINCPEGEGLAIGDIDGDGKSDIIIGGLWFKTPKDIFHDEWKAYHFAEWSPDATVRTADMNKDGRVDIILARSEGHYRLSWFENAVNGKLIEHVIDNDVDFVHSLVISDVNNDGELDIVIAEMHQSPRKRVMVYFNDGNSDKWTKEIVATTGSHNLCVADFGNIGTLMLVGANWSGDYQPIEIWKQIQ